MRLSRLGGWWLVAGFVLVEGLPSCAAPTLPLPPPVAATSAPLADGTVTVTGEVIEGAFVFCLNERTETGVIVRADPAGSFTLSLPARVDDDLSVWQQVGNDRSPSTFLVVPAM